MKVLTFYNENTNSERGDDLKEAVGEPITLFSASDAPWPTSIEHRTRKSKKNYVTDGPFMYHTSNGELYMLWASFVNNVYAQGISRSKTEKIEGEWKHEAEPLYVNDGGHGMLFHDLQNRLYVTLHSPNKTPEERPIFIRLEEQAGVIRRAK